MVRTVFEPKVSIIIPVYNGANYLKESIESALQQTYANIEILVINDGSNDGGETEKIARSYGDSIWYFCKANGGVSSALNHGIQMMTGEYFSWLSHDDMYSPSKVEDAVRLLSRLPAEDREKMIAFTGGHYIDDESHRKGTFPVLFEKEKIYSGDEVILAMLKRNTLNGCCMLIPKAAFEMCGSFDEDLRYNQDAMMWYVIFTNGYNLVSDNKSNVMYRLHRNQTSKLRRDLYLHDTIQASETIIPLLGEKSTRSNNLLYYYARRVAIGYCKKAVGMCLKYGIETGIFSKQNCIQLKLLSIYGKFRNIARTIRNHMMKG